MMGSSNKLLAARLASSSDFHVKKQIAGRVPLSRVVVMDSSSAPSFAFSCLRRLQVAFTQNRSSSVLDLSRLVLVSPALTEHLARIK
jgi:hypothetical protein